MCIRDRRQARRERHAEEPAGLQSDVDVRERQHEAQAQPGRCGAHRELRLPAAVGVSHPRGFIEPRDRTWVEVWHGAMMYRTTPDHPSVHGDGFMPVSYTHLRAHETPEHLVCRLLLEKKKK